MKILMCHNYYQQPGGEDKSFAAEADLLAAHGHEVLRYTRHNDELAEMSRGQMVRQTLWSQQTHDDLTKLLRDERPHIVHFTNTFPLISPAAYYAARDGGAAVVQSLRNYRLLCPNAQLLRDGRVCEDCLGKRIAWPAVVHGCYRDSRLASATVAAMTAWHWTQGTWRDAVDCYYALTEFSRRKFIEGGLPAEKIAVKPNFLDPIPAVGTGAAQNAVFVGRLSPEKGLDTLLAAWRTLTDDVPLTIVGDGPLAPQVRQAAEQDRRITWLGHRATPEILEIVGRAAFLVVPSLWYEGFPRTILEALALGTPAVVSQLGSMAEVIDDGRTGLHFPAGDAAALVRQVAALHADRQRSSQMRVAARAEFIAKYTAEHNYRQLLAIYDQAQAQSTTRGAAHGAGKSVAALHSAGRHAAAL